MEERAKVTIKQGKHSLKPLPNMAEAIEDALEKAELYGEFKVVLGKNIRGSEKVEVVKVCSLDPLTFGILLNVQADGRSSRHECVLYVPKQYKNEASQFFEKLLAATSQVEVIGQQSLVVEPESIKEDNMSITTTESDVKVKRQSPASCVLREDGLLNIAMCELSSCLDGGVNRKIALEAIARLGMHCSEKGTLDYLLKEELLSEEKISSHNRIIHLTEKGKELVAQAHCTETFLPVAQPAAPVEMVSPADQVLPAQSEQSKHHEDPVIDDVAEILEKLDGLIKSLAGKEKRNADCIQRLKFLDNEELRLSEELVAIEEERNLLMQEIDDLSKAHAKLQRIKDVL